MWKLQNEIENDDSFLFDLELPDVFKRKKDRNDDEHNNEIVNRDSYNISDFPDDPDDIDTTDHEQCMY
jgi:hypothetical protein